MFSVYRPSPALGAEIEQATLLLDEQYASGHPSPAEVTRLRKRIARLRNRRGFDYRMPANWVRLLVGIMAMGALWRLSIWVH